MKTLRASLLIVCLVCVGLLTGCLGQRMLVTEADDGSLITMDIGDRIDVRLTGNPSAGYTWTQVSPDSFDGAPIEPVSDSTCATPARCDPIGAPAAFNYSYRAVHSGTITLSYAYHRPWEDTALDTFSIIVWVRP